MPKKTMKELQKELKKRQALESVRNKKIGRYYEKKALEKKVKDLRFKQSKVGRTIVAGKVVFKRIGAVSKGIGQGFERTTRQLGKSQRDVSKPEKTLIGESIMGKPAKKKKPFSIDEVLSKMPQ
jgi:hypothetical protein